MPVALMSETPKKRRNRVKRDVQSVTFRLLKSVKLALADMADYTQKSENQQIEQFIRIGYLHSKGINIYGFNEIQIMDKFNELTEHLTDEDEGSDD